MAKINREQVGEQFKKVEEQIAELQKSLSTKKNYATCNKYLDGFGYIHEIETLPELVKVNKYVSSFNEDMDDSAKELGVQLETEETCINGIPVSEWKADIKQRVEEVKQLEKLAKLKAAKKILKKNLSSDDKFGMAMDEVSTLID